MTSFDNNVFENFSLTSLFTKSDKEETSGFRVVKSTQIVILTQNVEVEQCIIRAASCSSGKLLQQ